MDWKDIPAIARRHATRALPHCRRCWYGRPHPVATLDLPVPLLWVEHWWPDPTFPARALVQFPARSGGTLTNLVWQQVTRAQAADLLWSQLEALHSPYRRRLPRVTEATDGTPT